MSIGSTNVLSGRFAQMGYVTNDMDQALAVFAAQGVSKFLRTDDVRFRVGEGKEAHCNVALAFSGGLQIEIIQPLSGDVEVYRAPFVGDDFQLHFHHQCHWVDTMEEFETVKKGMQDRGHDIAIDGGYPGAVYFYADLRKQLGHFVEYVRYDPAVVEQFQGPIPVN